MKKRTQLFGRLNNNGYGLIRKIIWKFIFICKSDDSTNNLIYLKQKSIELIIHIYFNFTM